MAGLLLPRGPLAGSLLIGCLNATEGLSVEMWPSGLHLFLFFQLQQNQPCAPCPESVENKIGAEWGSWPIQDDEDNEARSFLEKGP